MAKDLSKLKKVRDRKTGQLKTYTAGGRKVTKLDYAKTRKKVSATAAEINAVQGQDYNKTMKQIYSSGNVLDQRGTVTPKRMGKQFRNQSLSITNPDLMSKGTVKTSNMAPINKKANLPKLQNKGVDKGLHHTQRDILDRKEEIKRTINKVKATPSKYKQLGEKHSGRSKADMAVADHKSSKRNLKQLNKKGWGPFLGEHNRVPHTPDEIRSARIDARPRLDSSKMTPVVQTYKNRPKLPEEAWEEMDRAGKNTPKTPQNPRAPKTYAPRSIVTEAQAIHELDRADTRRLAELNPRGEGGTTNERMSKLYDEKYVPDQRGTVTATRMGKGHRGKTPDSLHVTLAGETDPGPPKGSAGAMKTQPRVQKELMTPIPKEQASKLKTQHSADLSRKRTQWKKANQVKADRAHELEIGQKHKSTTVTAKKVQNVDPKGVKIEKVTGQADQYVGSSADDAGKHLTGAHTPTDIEQDSANKWLNKHDPDRQFTAKEKNKAERRMKRVHANRAKKVMEKPGMTRHSSVLQSSKMTPLGSGIKKGLVQSLPLERRVPLGTKTLPDAPKVHASPISSKKGKLYGKLTSATGKTLAKGGSGTIKRAMMSGARKLTHRVPIVGTLLAGATAAKGSTGADMFGSLVGGAEGLSPNADNPRGVSARHKVPKGTNFSKDKYKRRQVKPARARTY
jgi:hypothetical protein